jgi:hypothetical protein
VFPVSKAIRWAILAAALVAPLVGAACFDFHTAEECQYNGTCPLPDGGDGGDGSDQ